MTSNTDRNFLHGVLAELAARALESQQRDGSFPAGFNGPHCETETPVRNTAGWLYTLSYLIQSGDSDYADPAQRALDYLLSTAARPMRAAFYTRDAPAKDLSNGLIGQAFVLESLLYASTVLGRSDALETAVAVHHAHPWEASISAWRSLNVDGSYGKINATFNQQLWFSVMGCESGDEELIRRAHCFLDCVVTRVSLYSDGVVYHDSFAFRPLPIAKSSAKDVAKRVSQTFRKLGAKKNQRLRSVGYHAFNLVPLAMLRSAFPDHFFWNTKRYQRLMGATRNRQFRAECENNPFAYTYNPVGYELAYVEAKTNIKQDAEYYLARQVDLLVSGDHPAISGATDNATRLARSYELARWLSISNDQGVSVL